MAKRKGTYQLEISDTKGGSEMIYYPAGMKPRADLNYLTATRKNPLSSVDFRMAHTTPMVAEYHRRRGKRK